MLADLLSSLGFAILEASDGKEGLEQAEAAWPHLILMDIMMPVMDGLDATRRIRRNPDLLLVPIIAVSASAALEDQEGSLAAGANAFMTKPIDQDILLQHIGRLLGLVWIEELAVTPAAVEPESAGPLLVPPQEELEILYELALAGNMRDIRQHATHIAALSEQYAPFADKLNQLAKAYQSKAIVELVEEYVERRPL